MLLGLPGNVVERPSSELVNLFYDMNKKWLIGPVIMDYNCLLKCPLLEFYTYPQNVRSGKYLVEFYGKERYRSTDIGINIDKYMTHLKITLNDDQLLINKINYIYPQIKQITIHSQMTITTIENDTKSR